MRRTGIIILGWGLFLLIDLVKKPNLDFGSTYFFAYYLPSFIFWILITHPLFRIFRKTSEFQLVKRAGVLLSLGFMVGILKVMIMYGVFWLIIISLGGKSPGYVLITNTFYYSEATIIAWVLLIVFMVIETNNRYREKSLEAVQLQSALTQAHLQALKMQIQPHFLFNSLNTIASLMRSHNYITAEETLLKLSDLFRQSLVHFDNQFTTVEKEIEFINRYLGIEKLRFEDQLNVTISVQPMVKKLKVPTFILQPLVENAMKHGAGKSLGSVVIKLLVSQEDEKLKIHLFNTGELIDNYKNESGIGLKNVKRRLQMVYKSGASLKIKQDGSGVSVYLYIPISH